MFKNLELISIKNQRTSFPKHFHDTYCISLIHSGIEQIDFEDQQLFSEAGTISIANPYEVHSNPLIDKNNSLTFDTIYVPIDFMNYIFSGKKNILLNRKIECQEINQMFFKLKKVLMLNDSKFTESAIKDLILNLKPYALNKNDLKLENDFTELQDINLFIENHIQNKINLNELAKIANINKFGFIRKFKGSFGMTPINYILMRKIFSSKKLISVETELTDLAYQYNFTDLAHFSNTFKRYVGISPKEYQKNLVLP